MGDKTMKFAIISDIHGNYPALKAVLEDAKLKGAERFLFAGDYCLSGPWPNECMAEIRAIEDKYIIRGNEEKYLENLHRRIPERLRRCFSDACIYSGPEPVQ